MSRPSPSVPSYDGRVLLAVEEEASADLLGHRLILADSTSSE